MVKPVKTCQNMFSVDMDRKWRKYVVTQRLEHQRSEKGPHHLHRSSISLCEWCILKPACFQCILFLRHRCVENFCWEAASTADTWHNFRLHDFHDTSLTLSLQLTALTAPQRRSTTSTDADNCRIVTLHPSQLLLSLNISECKNKDLILSFQVHFDAFLMKDPCFSLAESIMLRPLHG